MCTYDMVEITEKDFMIIGECLGIDISHYKLLIGKIRRIPKPVKNVMVCEYEMVNVLESLGVIRVIKSDGVNCKFTVTENGRKVFKKYFRDYFKIAPILTSKDKDIIGFLNWLKLNCKCVNMLWEYKRVLYTDIEIYMKYKEVVI